MSGSVLQVVALCQLGPMLHVRPVRIWRQCFGTALDVFERDWHITSDIDADIDRVPASHPLVVDVAEQVQCALPCPVPCDHRVSCPPRGQTSSTLVTSLHLIIAPAPHPFVAEIEAKIVEVGERSGSFQKRNDLHKGLRHARHGRYLIFFIEKGDEVQIVRVLQGARDLPRLF